MTPLAEIRIRISAFGTGLLSRLNPYLDTNIVPDFIVTSPTDSSIRARKERHTDAIRVLVDVKYDWKFTFDLRAPTGAVKAVPRRLCEWPSE